MFNELKISEEEAVGKDFDGLIAILKRNDCSFGKDLKSYNELQAQMRILLNLNSDDFQKSVESAKLTQELYQYIAKPTYNYSIILLL